MSFIATSLRDSQSQKNASRLLDSDDLERRDAERRSDIGVIIENVGDIRLNENGCLYKPLVIVSSKLDALNGFIDGTSEVSSKLSEYPLDNSNHPDLSIPSFAYEDLIVSSRCTLQYLDM